jgi:hypothetical protein
MLNKLGGKKGNIDILLIEIKRWYKSSRSVVQIIEQDLVFKQPFQQIMVYYLCNINHSMERIVLAKYLKYQERSTCPTQINILSKNQFLTPDGNIANRPINIYFDEKFYLKKPNSTLNLFNKSNFYFNKKKKINQWNLFTKVYLQNFLLFNYSSLI